MRIWIQFVVGMILALFKPRALLLAENTVLRHQLMVLTRSGNKAHFHRSDRIFLAWLLNTFPEIQASIQIVRTETVIRWHRLGLKALWRWKSRPRGGRPKVPLESRNLIHQMNRECIPSALMRMRFKLIVGMILALFRPRAVLLAEIASLRQQLGVISRSGKKPRLRKSDRIFLAWLLSTFPEIRGSLKIVRPETVISWHRQGYRALWRWKSRPRGGRPKVSLEIRNLIRQINRENPLWGAPRIHGELKMLGINIAKSTVAKYMMNRSGPPSQSWKTFLDNHIGDIASVDFLIVPTVTFNRLYAFVVLGHDRRKLLHIEVTDHPSAIWTAQQITEAFPSDEAPKHLIRDNDGIYGRHFKRRLSSMGIRDRPTSFRSPWQNGYVERVIGSIRRECLDQMIVRDQGHLRRILKSYQVYYNSVRTHLSLDKNTPQHRTINESGLIKTLPYLGGLHHQYVRI